MAFEYFHAKMLQVFTSITKKDSYETYTTNYLTLPPCTPSDA